MSRIAVVVLGLGTLAAVSAAQPAQNLPTAVTTAPAANTVTVQNDRNVPVTVYLESGPFDRRLGEGEKRWLAAMAPYKGLKIVTYHRSWTNFAKEFGLDVIGYVEPKPGIPPSPSHLARLIERMKEVGAKLILVEPYYEKKNPELVARETGATVVELPNQPGAGTDSYFGMIDQIVDRLAEAARSAGTAAR